ncbi:MAG: putative nucleoside transporter YegT [Daejeonella sp.]|nr:putative nucleoside transporter YegT [Daejeonella sp.]
MPLSIRFRLSVLMLLQYFIWGAWYVTMGTYLFKALNANALQIGSAYANLSIAAIISPFFVGLIADRFFSAQKVLGFLHLLGAFVLYLTSNIREFNDFWWLILLYTLLYMPTISLANSISFAQLKNPGKEFPSVRVFGTLGWIVAGLLIGFMNIESSALTFRIGAICSLCLGLFSFFLPNTPPKKQKATLAVILGTDALVMFKSRSFSVFFISSIIICIPLAFYYGFTNPFLNDVGVQNAAAKMTLGQASEFVFMLIMPLLFIKLGVKKMLLLGMLAWVIRYTFFAFGNSGSEMWMLYGGIILHGICYDFFFVTGQIYIDNKAHPAIKNAAQGLITFATYGVGMLIGSYLSGFITNRYTFHDNGMVRHDWLSIWLTPAFIVVVVIVFFLMLFKEKKIVEPESLNL